MVKIMGLRSIVAFVIYAVVYIFITYYTYTVINEVFPKKVYLAVAFIVMCMPLYLLGLLIAHLVRPYVPAISALMFGGIGFTALLFVKSDPLVVIENTRLPQEAPYTVYSFNHFLAIIAAFCIAMLARQVFWLVTENIRFFFKTNDF
jgi:hypothetical protein